MALMGVREYGRHRNVSHVAVLKAIRSGRVRRNPDGLIDAEQADRDWGRNTHPAPRAPRAGPIAADSGFAQARTIRMVYEAKLAKLEYEERAAELLSAAEVKILAARARRAFNAHMLRVPGRVAAAVAAEHDPHRVHEMLAGVIRQALIEFADGDVEI